MGRRAPHRIAASFVVLSALAAPSPAQDRAQEVLAQARQALGNQATLDGITSLKATGTIRPANTDIQMSLDVDWEFLLPDKYRKTDTFGFGSFRATLITGVSGDRLLYDDGGRAAAAGMDPNGDAARRESLVKELKQECLRLLTVWLLPSPRELPIAIAYAGEAQAPDGTADVLDVKGPGDFALRLFLDKQAHRLLMATYPTEQPAIDKRELEALHRKAAESGGARAVNDALAKVPRKTVTVEMRFSDYRSSGGVWFPHRVTVTSEGEGVGEWTISAFKVNPPLKPDRFQRR